MLFLKIHNILQDVVTEWILDKMEGAGGNLANELGFLWACGMVDTTLQDTTTMAMGANCNAVCSNGVKDKL